MPTTSSAAVPHSAPPQPEAYGALLDRFQRIGRLSEALGVLEWDRSTMMPRGGGASRAEQIAVLSATIHTMLTEAKTADLLDAAEQSPPTDAWHQANLKAMRRDWVHASALPEDLVVALSRAASACETAWRTARPAADFAAVQSELAHLLTLVRESAVAKAAHLGLSPYDSLLDQYEPGGRAADIDPIFDDLSAFLPEFLGQVLEKQASREQPPHPEGPFAVTDQEALGREIMTMMGFDFDHGRLDVSLHPFCGGSPADLRLTTRYDTADFTSALMGVIHETGHALYEMGLPQDHLPQPAAAAGGMSLHESQSLLMEMQAARSRNFLSYLAPKLRDQFHQSGPAWETEALYRLYTRVERGFIRVDADEVTYPAHVILRYRLETAMISGDLYVQDLPQAWNDGMHALLGVTPPDDRMGCLQDIHWYDGAFGYFPTYTLGAMTAAQLFQAAVAAHPAIPEDLTRGDFSTLLAWLRSHVHSHGAALTASEILTKATGKPLDPTVFKEHLRRRYLLDDEPG